MADLEIMEAASFTASVSSDIGSGARPTVVNLLHMRALRQPTQVAYTFLDDDSRAKSYTYAELESAASAVSSQLCEKVAVGARALLLYPSGPEFIAAFLGCLRAGVIAVPAYPPDPRRFPPIMSRLETIAQDAGVLVVLTTPTFLAFAESGLELPAYLSNLPWLATDLTSDATNSRSVSPIDRNSIAMLQYTSGSTAAPKGVMVSHDNLMDSQETIQAACRSGMDDIILGWLPLYHDLGLIGHVLHPLYLGAHGIIMSPVSFLQRPYSWLKAISDYRATISGGPNFAYDLCVRRTTAEEREYLDLSTWQIAINGAEPIRKETIDQFSTTFFSCGFRREAFHSAYGLAEATLAVTAGKRGQEPASLQLDMSALKFNQVLTGDAVESKPIVSCGRILPRTRVVIVNPESHLRCEAGEIGEVWVNSPTVASGYWNRPEETDSTFHARLADEPLKYLRTDDLGFLNSGELFITGRLKDLVTLDGRS